jgi:peroxiredoxin
MESANDVKTAGTSQRIRPGWLAAFAVGLLVFALVVYALLARPVSPPQIGESVPGFELSAVNGGTMDLGSHRGEVVVINVFASWCDPCRQEAVDIEQTWREYEDRGVQFFGIAFKDAASKAQAFLDEFDVTYPYAAESSNRTARSLGVTKVPETFVVDQTGRLFHHFIGPVTKADLSSQLDLLLGD